MTSSCAGVNRAASTSPVCTSSPRPTTERAWTSRPTLVRWLVPGAPPRLGLFPPGPSLSGNPRSSVARPQPPYRLVVSGLAEDQQLMSTGIGETVGSFGRELG